MSFANEARGRLTKAQNVLMARWPNTSDKKEQDAIDHALTVLIETRGLLNQAALLEAAAVVVDATRALETVVRSARLGPFDDYVTKLEGALEEIGDLLRNGEVGEHLERAPEPVVAAPSANRANRREPNIPWKWSSCSSVWPQYSNFWWCFPIRQCFCPDKHQPNGNAHRQCSYADNHHTHWRCFHARNTQAAKHRLYGGWSRTATDRNECEFYDTKIRARCLV